MIEESNVEVTKTNLTTKDTKDTTDLEEDQSLLRVLRDLRGQYVFVVFAVQIARATSFIAPFAAAIVFFTSRSLWAAERNHASNCDGGG